MNTNNNLKYVMLPRIEEKPKEVKQQPWYRERLREKYLKGGGPKGKGATTLGKERILNGKEWVFIKEGLDDFRDGLPPDHEDLIIKPDKGPSPMLKTTDKTSTKPRVASTKSASSSRLTLNQRCYSKRIPMVQARREKIEQIISDLTQHPLALYSHLEDSLPPDLFDDIVQILDPELTRMGGETSESRQSTSDAIDSSNTESQYRRSRRDDIKEELIKLEESLKKVNAGNEDESGEMKTIRNKYKWLLKKEEAKARAKGPEPEQIKAEAIDNHIKKVTVEFCDWVKSLGGEHNIDPLTLTSLFASGYETKPPISVPIHVVELTNIPMELRQNAYVPADVVNEEEELEKLIYRSENTTTRQGQRYGAWYLPKEHWRLMPLGEKLVDPKAKLDEQEEEAKKRSEEINARLAPLHGAQAFKSFVKQRKPERVPKLLSELDEWEKEQQANRKAKNSGLNSSINDLNKLSSSSANISLLADNKDDKPPDNL